MGDTPVLEELAEWRRWANALVGQMNSDAEQRTAIGRRVSPNFTPVDPGTWIRDVTGSWVVRWPSGCETGYAAHEIRPRSFEWEARNPPAARRPIERYLRAAVEIPGSKGRVDGTVEIGLHRERHEKPSWYRDKLIELGEVALRVLRGRALDEDTADEITEDLDARIVGFWGDRPRFIEVWRGTGDDAEPLTQVYAPHGMPIARTP